MRGIGHGWEVAGMRGGECVGSCVMEAKALGNTGRRSGGPLEGRAAEGVGVMLPEVAIEG